jgi:hypothetical protein
MIVNFIGFYLAWIGLVLVGNLFIPFAIGLIALHLSMVVKSSRLRIAEVKLITSLVIVGVIVDNALTYFSVFNFPGNSSINFIAIPLWLVVLWACFAATIAHSLKPIGHSRLLQAAIGAVFAPMSYVAGQKLGAVEFVYSFLNTYIVLAVVWAFLLILSFQLKHFFFEREANE